MVHDEVFCIYCGNYLYETHSRLGKHLILAKFKIKRCENATLGVLIPSPVM